MVCWGDNGAGQSDAPAGQFLSVSAGSGRTCALRESGEIACWGEPQGLTPSGIYRAVGAGDVHNCAVTEAGLVTCWMEEAVELPGQHTPPGGSYQVVSAGADHACGVRDSGEVVCWGANEYGQVDAPAGNYRSVSAGASHSCALRDSGEVDCWGFGYSGDRICVRESGASADLCGEGPPRGPFQSVSAGSLVACGVLASGEISCWGINDGVVPPAGRFRAVSAGGNGLICGVRETGPIVCWLNLHGNGSETEGELQIRKRWFRASSLCSSRFWRGGLWGWVPWRQARHSPLRELSSCECWLRSRLRPP